MISQFLSEDGEKIAIDLSLDLLRSEIDDTIAQFTESLKDKRQVKITVTAGNQDENLLISSARPNPPFNLG